MNVIVIKRNGSTQEWDSQRINRAVFKACEETAIAESKALEISKDVANHIELMISSSGKKQVTVEAIQKMVEDYLFEKYNPKLGINYRDYRKGQEKARNSKTGKKQLLSDGFISKYKHKESPMTRLGEAVYFRTYSRFLEDQQRREYWWETVRRAVEYNCSLATTSVQEAEMLFDNIFNLRQFLSGRTLWVGGTPVAHKFPMANFNCSFHIINRVQAFRDAMYLLLVGVGVGMRVTKEDALMMPKFRADVMLKHMSYMYLGKNNGIDLSYMQISSNVAKIVVGDSKEGKPTSAQPSINLVNLQM